MNSTTDSNPIFLANIYIYILCCIHIHTQKHGPVAGSTATEDHCRMPVAWHIYGARLADTGTD